MSEHGHKPSSEKIHHKVFFHFYTSEGYKGRWIYQQRHMRFSEKDVPMLFERRPFKDQEPSLPDWLYRIDREGIHIAVFVGCKAEQALLEKRE